MKKLLLFATIAFMALSCKPEVIPQVTINSPAESLIIDDIGGDVSLAFVSNVPWSASIKEADASSWCTINPASGEAGNFTIKVAALGNKETSNRTVTIVITGTSKEGASATAQATITQLQKDALVISGEKSFTVPAEGGEVKFTVSHNIAFEVASDAAWLVPANTKAMENSEVVFGVKANTGEERTGKITVTSDAATETITVTQEAFVPELNISTDGDIWLGVDGGGYTLTVDANIEYDVTVGDNDWITMTKDGDKFTFVAAANDGWNYRAVDVLVNAKDEKYAEIGKSFYIFQNGHATALWTKNPVDYEGYNPTAPVRLAKYGDYIALANTSKVYILNPNDGSVVKSFETGGFAANSVCVDDAGHIIVANDAPYGGVVTIATVDESSNITPITEWNTGNYYGINAGNLRVKGDITKEAVMTATVSLGAGGAAIIWQFKDGVCSDWSWVNVPYEVSSVNFGCVAPAGTKISDGLFYLGYGGDYNIKYLASPELGSGGNAWVTSYVTGYSWMENLNCFSTCDYNGKKYGAFTAGCHFNYDDAEAILLDITDPAKAELVYTYSATYDVVREESWANTQFSNGGAYSDILIFTKDDTLFMVYVDSNYGSMACIAIK